MSSPTPQMSGPVKSHDIDSLLKQINRKIELTTVEEYEMANSLQFNVTRQLASLNRSSSSSSLLSSSSGDVTNTESRKRRANNTLSPPVFTGKAFIEQLLALKSIRSRDEAKAVAQDLLVRGAITAVSCNVYPVSPQAPPAFDERGLYTRQPYEELNERQIGALITALKNSKCISDRQCKVGFVTNTFMGSAAVQSWMDLQDISFGSRDASTSFGQELLNKGYIHSIKGYSDVFKDSKDVFTLTEGDFYRYWGILLKRGGKSHAWNLRWVLLKSIDEKKIWIYQTPQSSKPRKFIALENAVVKLSSDVPLGFEICTLNRVWEFRALSSMALNAWLNHLETMTEQTTLDNQHIDRSEDLLVSTQQDWTLCLIKKYYDGQVSAAEEDDDESEDESDGNNEQELNLDLNLENDDDKLEDAPAAPEGESTKEDEEKTVVEEKANEDMTQCKKEDGKEELDQSAPSHVAATNGISSETNSIPDPTTTTATTTTTTTVTDKEEKGDSELSSKDHHSSIHNLLVSTVTAGSNSGRGETIVLSKSQPCLCCAELELAPGETVTCAIVATTQNTVFFATSTRALYSVPFEDTDDPKPSVVTLMTDETTTPDQPITAMISCMLEGEGENPEESSVFEYFWCADNTGTAYIWDFFKKRLVMKHRISKEARPPVFVTNCQPPEGPIATEATSDYPSAVFSAGSQPGTIIVHRLCTASGSPDFGKVASSKALHIPDCTERITALRISRDGTMWIAAGNDIYMCVFDETERTVFRRLNIFNDVNHDMLSPVQTILLCRSKEAWTVHANGEIGKWQIRYSEEREKKKCRNDLCIMRGSSTIANALILYDGSLLIVPDSADSKAIRISRFLDVRQRIVMNSNQHRPFRPLCTNTANDLLAVISSVPPKQPGATTTATHVLNVFVMATTKLSEQ